MKNFFLVVALASMILSTHYTNAITLDTSHCNSVKDPELCVKRTYSKNITIQNTLIKKSFKNNIFLRTTIDNFITKYETSSEKINRLALRAINEIDALSDSTQDQNLQLLFEYILFKAQYTSIELNIASAKLAEEEGKIYKLDLPNTPKDIGDYTAIIGYLAEEEIGKYINDLDYKDKEKLAKKITLKNQEIITYFSFEERDVSNANAIEKNVYYRLLIFYEYLEDNPNVWEEYKAKRNQK